MPKLETSANFVATRAGFQREFPASVSWALEMCIYRILLLLLLPHCLCQILATKRILFWETDTDTHGRP